MDTGFKKTAMRTAVGRLRSSWPVGCMDFVLMQRGGCDGDDDDDMDEVCHVFCGIAFQLTDIDTQIDSKRGLGIPLAQRYHEIRRARTQ